MRIERKTFIAVPLDSTTETSTIASSVPSVTPWCLLPRSDNASDKTHELQPAELGYPSCSHPFRHEDAAVLTKAGIVRVHEFSILPFVTVRADRHSVRRGDARHVVAETSDDFVL